VKATTAHGFMVEVTERRRLHRLTIALLRLSPRVIYFFLRWNFGIKDQPDAIEAPRNDEDAETARYNCVAKRAGRPHGRPASSFQVITTVCIDGTEIIAEGTKRGNRFQMNLFLGPIIE